MTRLNLRLGAAQTLRVLCLGSHSDDIEIGCGGTILQLAEQFPHSRFHWVVFSAIGAREQEARRAANMFVGRNLEEPLVKAFRDGFLPFCGVEVKTIFEELKGRVSPHIIFTHNRYDAHQDHRLVADLTWNTFRDHLILEYEIPKYDGDLGQPGVFVPLSRETCQKKVRYLMEAFPTQRAKDWFEETTFLSLMRLRGMECHAASGYAEAFFGRKLTLGIEGRSQ